MRKVVSKYIYITEQRATACTRAQIHNQGPVGLALLFLALTSGTNPAYQRRMAINGTTLANAMLLVFYIAGDLLLAALWIVILPFALPVQFMVNGHHIGFHG